MTEEIKDFEEEFDDICDENPCLVIGQLALRYKFISGEQLKEALSLSKEGKQETRRCLLGKILVMKRMISPEQLNSLLLRQNFLEIRRLDRKFGGIAISNGFATKEEINLALEEQRKILESNKSVRIIGDILVDSGILTERQRDAVLLRQQRLGVLFKGCLQKYT